MLLRLINSLKEAQLRNYNAPMCIAKEEKTGVEKSLAMATPELLRSPRRKRRNKMLMGAIEATKQMKACGRIPAPSF